MTGFPQPGFEPPEPRGAIARWRSFTAIQWLGAAFILLGLLFFAAYVLGRVGVVRRFDNDLLPEIVLLLCGSVLINPRRPQPCADPEALRRRRMIALALAILAVILGAVLVILIASGR